MAGIVFTGGMNLAVERGKVAISAKEARRVANRTRCKGLLASVEEEIDDAYRYKDQYGVLPAGDGQSMSPANAWTLLTDIELNCPPRVHSSAVDLIKALERHLSDGGKVEDYHDARKWFIRQIQSL